MTLLNEKNDPVEGERKVLDLIVQAHNEFCALPRQHPNELQEWVSRVHNLQDLIGLRVARAYRPDIFPIKT